MEFPNEHIIEVLYNSGIFAEAESSPEYKQIVGEYNDLFDTIEDKELQEKLEKLEELKNKLYSETDKQIFKVGFSLATKMLIEALTCKF